MEIGFKRIEKPNGIRFDKVNRHVLKNDKLIEENSNKVVTIKDCMFIDIEDNNVNYYTSNHNHGYCLIRIKCPAKLNMHAPSLWMCTLELTQIEFSKIVEADFDPTKKFDLNISLGLNNKSLRIGITQEIV